MSNPTDTNAPVTASQIEAPMVSKVEEEVPKASKNTRRDARLKNFKPSMSQNKFSAIKESPPPPRNPTISEDDARVTVTIRLETRHAVIHERIGEKDSYQFLIPKGNIQETSLTRLSEIIAAVAAAAKDDYKKHLDLNRPATFSSPKEEKDEFSTKPKDQLLTMFDAGSSRQEALSVQASTEDVN